MLGYFEDIFSKYQCGFRISYSAEHCLLLMIEKWKKSRSWGCLVALQTCLSKVFNCLPHEPIIAKLEAYGRICLFMTIFQIENKE